MKKKKGRQHRDEKEKNDVSKKKRERERGSNAFIFASIILTRWLFGWWLFLSCTTQKVCVWERISWCVMSLWPDSRIPLSPMYLQGCEGAIEVREREREEKEKKVVVCLVTLTFRACPLVPRAGHWWLAATWRDYDWILDRHCDMETKARREKKKRWDERKKERRDDDVRWLSELSNLGASKSFLARRERRSISRRAFFLFYSTLVTSFHPPHKPLLCVLCLLSSLSSLLRPVYVLLISSSLSLSSLLAQSHKRQISCATNLCPSVLCGVAFISRDTYESACWVFHFFFSFFFRVPLKYWQLVSTLTAILKQI